MNTPTNKKNRYQQEQAIAAGVSEHLAKGESFVLLGKKYSTAELVTLSEERATALGDAVVAHELWRKAVAKADAKIAATAPVAAALRQTLLVRFGDDPDILAKMMLAARKRAVTRTLDDRKAAATKAKATRAARHTMGKKEKLLVTGDTAPAAAPATATPPPTAQAIAAPPSPSPSPSPAINVTVNSVTPTPSPAPVITPAPAVATTSQAPPPTATPVTTQTAPAAPPNGVANGAPVTNGAG